MSGDRKRLNNAHSLAPTESRELDRLLMETGQKHLQTNAHPFTKIGWICGVTDKGYEVDFPDNPHGPLIARSTVKLEGTSIQQMIQNKWEVLLVFESNKLNQPIIIGRLEQPSSTPMIDMILDADPDHELRELDLQVDGQTVAITGKREVVLRCGQSSLSLRHDGKIVLQGTHILSRSRFTNRIKGGSVQIN